MSLDTSAPKQLGNYDIVSKIAEGGMGTVYKARHRATGEIVAVKVIAPGTAKNGVLLQRFEREFVAARVLDHPNVVKALEYCGTGPHPFLVMEYVDGDSLGQILERKGALAEAQAVRLIGQVCEGLQRAHKQGLVHRDVKPDNILVTRDGIAKLTDMGLVKDVEGDLNLTKTGRGLGTPHYMAPEQFRNAKGVDVRGDIYSLGATLYALVTGVIPFENASPLDCWMKKIRNEFPPPKELNPAISDRVDWAIRRAMSAEPDRRPASCREFLEDLTGTSRTTPTGQPPSTAGNADVWYVVYKDETGTAHTVKGSTEGLRNALRDNLLGDPSVILVSRTKTGQFQQLTSVAEFRDLIVAPAALPTPGGQRTGSSGVLGRGSGAIAYPTGRTQSPGEDSVDLGASPGSNPGASASRASRSGRAGGASSGRYAAGQTPTPANTSPTRRTPAEVPPPSGRFDPQAQVPTDVQTPLTRTVPVPTRRSTRKSKSSFPWALILLLVVTAAATALGYLVYTKQIAWPR